MISKRQIDYLRLNFLSRVCVCVCELKSILIIPKCLLQISTFEPDLTVGDIQRWLALNCALAETIQVNHKLHFYIETNKVNTIHTMIIHNKWKMKQRVQLRTMLHYTVSISFSFLLLFIFLSLWQIFWEQHFFVRSSY
jgi:hypothetical protein